MPSNAALKAVPEARFDPGTDQRRQSLANLKHVSDKTVICRGDVHRWPRWRLSAGPMKGMRSLPQRDGTYFLIQACLDCGRERYKVTLPKGYLDPGATWRYRKGPQDFSHPGEFLTKADFRAELDRRIDDGGYIADMAAREEAEAEEQAQS